MGIRERRARDRETLREEILEAARSLFVKEGYDNVSIRKIADKIEYAPGTIYLYFKDKADILRTICDETFDKLHRRLSAIAEDSGPPLEKLRRAGRSYIQFALDHPSEYQLIFMSRFETLAVKYDPGDVGSNCFLDLCHIVQQCVEEGRLRSSDVNEISQTIWACVHGVAALLIAKCDFPFIERSRLIESVIETTLDGITKMA